jgi:hypothetical protein
MARVVWANVDLCPCTIHVRKIALLSHLRSTMSWKIALAVALLTGIITALVTIPVADHVTRMHSVSDREGARAMGIVFFLAPLALVGGLLLGLLGTKLVGAVEWAQFGRALGVSLLLSVGAVVGIAGLSILSIPRPPVALGKPLALEVEVLVPRAEVPTDVRTPDVLSMSLYAGDNDNHTIPLDTVAFREEGDLLVVPVTATLNSRSSTRILSFHIGTERWLAFDLPLPAEPAVSAAWSDPGPMRDATTSGPNSVWSTVQLRYRVVSVN